MRKTVSVEYLKNYPHFVPIVAEWLFNKWGHQIAGDTLAAAGKRVEGRLNDDKIPFSLIAIKEGEAVGTASIFLNDMDTRPELSPWLAAVYVKENSRGLGIGSELVRSAEETARKLGTRKLYLFTPDKQSFYKRLGWVYLEDTSYRGGLVTILEKLLLC